MKKYIKHHLPRISAWFVSLLLLLSGCTDESPIGNHLVKEGEKVKLRVYFDIPKQQTAQTRSALDDDSINPNGLYILVFDTEDTLVEVDKATSVGTAENPLFFTNLTSTNQQRNVYILANAAGGIIMHAAANIGFETRVAERMATVYLARSNDKGRVKVILKQKKLDIYRDKIQIEPYTYIGTFHRWYQTGERVIRIQPSVAGPTSQWTVVVVEGQDWIELSISRSPDWEQTLCRAW